MTSPAQAPTYVEDADQGVVADRRTRRLTWLACALVLVVATALTVVLLLLQWMSSGSGTVAR